MVIYMREEKMKICSPYKNQPQKLKKDPQKYQKPK